MKQHTCMWVLIGMAALLWTSSTSAQVSVSVDRSARYQTVEGFGAAVAIQPWNEKVGPFYQQIDLDEVGFYDTLVSELGVTAMRVYFDGSLESAPGTIDNPGAMTDRYADMVKLKEAADRQNEPLRFITSCWSPPGYMKVYGQVPCHDEAAPNCLSHPCRLIDGMEDDLAGFFFRYVNHTKAQTGLDFYAFSIQNEPRFSEPYASCVYCQSTYPTVLNETASLFSQNGITTRFFGAEHMSHAFGYYENSIRANPAALSNMHAWAVHGYTDGVQTDTGAYSGSTPTDKPLWMTETSGSGYGETVRDWPRALTLANNILSYLRNGKMALWTWWTLQHVTDTDFSSYTGAGGCLIVNGTGTDKYYASSHFYRYVRPGARQIGSTSSNSSVKVVAFYHEANDCMSIVLLNSGGATSVSGITGGNVPAQFEMVTSTADAKLQRSTVSSGSSIALPASSITTLVAGTYRGSGTHVIQEPAHRRAVDRVPRGALRSRRVFSLDGRQVLAGSRTTGPARLPRGTYIRAGADTQGRVVATEKLLVE